MKINFYNISGSNEKRLKPLAKKASKFAPWWCRAIHITLDQTMSPQLSMAIATSKEYRWMTIDIGQGVIDSASDDDLLDMFIHEICHGYNDEVRSIITEVLPELLDEAGEKVVNLLFTRAIEAQTEDMSVMFKELL